jgi:tRNA (adenine57-N1/adenine58-N1)-methyltransferase
VKRETINQGDKVLLYLNPRRTYLITVENGKSLHTHKGYVQHDSLMGKKFGTKTTSNIGTEFFVLKPALRDYIYKTQRRTQIMYPKDIALIVMFSDIGPGSKIAEAGTGTGALTTALAHYVKPTGKVYSYEIRPEFIETAQKNLEKAGVAKYVKITNKDVTQGIDRKNVDAVILDLATPWLVVPHAYTALKGSGALVSFSPTIDQVVKTVEAINENKFIDTQTIECLLRGMQTERGKTRPETLMTAHTGYITFARKSI